MDRRRGRDPGIFTCDRPRRVAPSRSGIRAMMTSALHARLARRRRTPVPGRPLSDEAPSHAGTRTFAHPRRRHGRFHFSGREEMASKMGCAGRDGVTFPPDHLRSPRRPVAPSPPPPLTPRPLPRPGPPTSIVGQFRRMSARQLQRLPTAAAPRAPLPPPA